MKERFGLTSLREKRIKICRIDELNDPFELMPYNLANKNHRRALQATRQQIGASRGLLCLSASWHDPVMWAHYSDNHRGMCLGFELPDDGQVFKKVRYIAARLPFPTNLSLAEVETMLFTKYANWRYEQEIRGFAALEKDDNGLYFCEFGTTLRLVEVIAGAQSTLSRTALTDALGTLAGEVRLIKARPGFQRFEIVRQRKGLT